MTTEADKNRGGYSYHYTAEQIQAFQELSIEQRLKWVEEMNKFLYKFRSPQSKEICEQFRRGTI
jgi:predicted transcriptional regulator